MSKAVTGNTRVTLVDVAKRANVSSMSVSNFINGRFDMMAEATQERIASAVVELNYRQDTAARSLRISRTHSVGLIVVDDSPTYLSDGYTTQLVSGLGEALNSSGYTLQIEGLRAAKLSNSRLVRHRQTDGLCVLPSGGKSVRKKDNFDSRGDGSAFCCPVGVIARRLERRLLCHADRQEGCPRIGTSCSRAGRPSNTFHETDAQSVAGSDRTADRHRRGRGQVCAGG